MSGDPRLFLRCDSDVSSEDATHETQGAPTGHTIPSTQENERLLVAFARITDASFRQVVLELIEKLI